MLTSLLVWSTLGSEFSFEVSVVSVGVLVSLFVLSSSVDSVLSFELFVSIGALTSLSVISTLLASQLSIEMSVASV